MRTSNSDSVITSVHSQPNQQDSSVLEIEYPRLNCQVSFYSDAIILSQKDFSYRLPCQPHTIEGMKRLLLKMNGHHHLHQLQQQFFPENPEAINQFIQQLVNHGFLEDANNTTLDLRQNSILKWEELFVERLSEKLKQQSLQFLAASPPTDFNYSFALEYYHLLSHSKDFYTPLLNFQHSPKIRRYLNQYYCQIYQQDELLIQGFQGLGMSREDIDDTLPLPETVALYNALTFWANCDPLFCLSLLAVWEIQLLQAWKTYLNQFPLASVDPLFLTAIQQLIQLKLQSQPDGLRHLIISELSPLENSMLERFQRQTHLFVELNQGFYRAIANHYSSQSYSLRKLSTIEWRGQQDVSSN